MTCNRRRTASSSCIIMSALRGRANGTATGTLKVAPGPRPKAMMRSDNNTASSTEFVIIKTVARGCCASHSFINSVCSVARVNASSAPKGSSRNKTLGSTAKARAMATRWRMPPESWLGFLAPAAPRPTIERYFWACSATLAFDQSGKALSTASSTLAEALSHGSSE